MYYRLFLVFALLYYCTGESSVSGSPEKVLAYVGEDVILPCSFNIAPSGDIPTMEWSKEGLKPNVIFLYRDGCETFEMKHPAFEYRSSLIMKELKNGNGSLRISNIQLSDAGTYQCKRIWENASQEVTTVELVVGELKLRMVSAESGGVTLQCEANYWLHQPELKFLDDQGNDLPAEDPRRDQDANGCDTVRRRLTLQTATNSVTCRVHQPEFNQTRDTEILIPAACVRSCWLTTIIAGIIIFVLAFGCGFFTFWLYEKCHKSDAQKLPVTRQESDQSTGSRTSEDQSLLQNRKMADNVKNSTIENLGREVSQLQATIREKNETISQLHNSLSCQIRPVICQHTQPTIVCSAFKSSLDVPKSITLDACTSTNDLISTSTVSTSTVSANNHHPKSAGCRSNKGPMPDLQRQNSYPLSDRSNQRKLRRYSTPTDDTVSSSSSVSSSKKKLALIGRSMSECFTQPHPNSTNIQRSNSLGNTMSLFSSNRFSLLAKLKEESDPLITCEQSPKQ